MPKTGADLLILKLTIVPLALLIFVVVALIWIVPDSRIEQALQKVSSDR